MIFGIMLVICLKAEAWDPQNYIIGKSIAKRGHWQSPAEELSCASEGGGDEEESSVKMSERNAAIVKAVANGEATYAELGKRFGITAQRIEQICAMNGVKSIMEWNGPDPKLNERQRKKIIEYYLKGDSAMKIAKRFGVSNSTVTKYLSHAGIPRRKTPLKLTPDQHRDLISLRKKGMSYEKLGKRFGISAMAAWYYVEDRKPLGSRQRKERLTLA